MCLLLEISVFNNRIFYNPKVIFESHSFNNLLFDSDHLNEHRPEILRDTIIIIGAGRIPFVKHLKPNYLVIRNNRWNVVTPQKSYEDIYTSRLPSDGMLLRKRTIFSFLRNKDNDRIVRKVKRFHALWIVWTRFPGSRVDTEHIDEIISIDVNAKRCVLSLIMYAKINNWTMTNCVRV